MELGDFICQRGLVELVRIAHSVKKYLRLMPTPAVPLGMRSVSITISPQSDWWAALPYEWGSRPLPKLYGAKKEKVSYLFKLA